jgi:NADPH-dependent glutamate synthase beta subunit-like oxidoreductase
MGLSPAQALGVYMKKHLDAIFTFIGKGRVESEPIEGRIHDAVNYLLLLNKLIAYEKRQAAERLPGD